MSSFIRRASVAASVCSILAAAVAHAADPGPRPDEVIVTAARIAQQQSRVIGATSVITREDIERRQAHSVPELLRGETGLNVVNNGGLGKLTNVFVRGADAEQVLVLIDGVRMGSATSGTTAFEFLPVDQIERIEIVRGPRSSIYGADALGGVIQIFTRRGDGLAFNLGAGSDEKYTGGASFGATAESGWFSASASRLQTEGYNSCIGRPATPPTFADGGGCFTDEPDADGYDNTSGSVRMGFKAGERADVEATAVLAQGTSEFDGGFANEVDFRQTAFTVRGRLQPTDAWRLALTLGESTDEQDNFYDDPLSDEPAIESGVFDTERVSASLQSDLSLGAAHTITVGADYLDDSVETTTAYDETSRDNIGLYAQHQGLFGAHETLVSARYDDNEQFGSHSTASVGWKWAFASNYAVTAAWGSAFGAPTFNDLYFPGFGNPDLDPESARSYEVGLRGGESELRWAVTAFESRVDDLIVFDASISLPNNLNEARIRGLELDASASLADWTLGLGYAGIDPRNRSHGPNYDNILPRRARHSGHLEIGRSFGPADARARVTAESSRYDDVANTHRVGSYATLDLTLDYELSEEWSVQAKIANALDREYRTVRFYNQDDRTFFASVRYQPR
jgi:vitamin B12 transporter